MKHKFLHLADVHFDTLFLCRSEALRERLRKELYAAFRRAIDFAINEKMMAVVIAGDLLEGNRLSLATESFLLEQLRRLDEAQIPCIYVAGHADPGDATSKTMEMAWPPSFVYVKTDAPKVIELQDVDGSAIARLVGIGHETTAGTDVSQAVPRIPKAQGITPYVGIMHRMDAGTQELDDAPATPADVNGMKEAGYTYWALGGKHACQPMSEMAQAWYAGSLIGTSASETGAKGGLVVTLKPGYGMETEFKAFSRVQWYHVVMDELEDVQGIEDLARLAELTFAVQAEGNDSVPVRLVQITLEGTCPLADELQAEARRATIEEKIAQRLQVDDVELRLRKLTLPVETDVHRDKPHLLGEVLHLIDAASEDTAFLNELAPDPLASQFTSDEQKNAYLKGLVEALDREAVVRLTREE